MEVDSTDASTMETTLYISGSPGTGKTALVNSVLRDLESGPDLKVVSVNCMALNNVDALWNHLLDELLDGKKVKGRGKKPKGREAVLKALSDMHHSRWYVYLLPTSTASQLICLA
jgi:cell division control protein 6